MMDSYKDLLKRANTILLVDWPNVDVPLSLLKAGFKVISWAPGEYSAVSPGKNETDIIFSALNGSPGTVDIVNIFRPEEEHAAIIEDHVLPLTAKVVWLHPPVTSAKTKHLALQHGLIFIEGYDISIVAGSGVQE